MRKWHRIFSLFALLLVAACGEERPAIFELRGSTMGTEFSVKLPAMTDGVDASLLQQEIIDSLEQTELQMSTYRVDSEISRFNVSESDDWQIVSMELCLAVAESLSISERTSGAFDITVGPLVNLWGFGPDGSIVRPPGDADITAARSRVGYIHLQADCSMPALRKDITRLYLDMSGYAKGYGVDRLAEILDRHGTADYLVEIGGEMRLRGHNARRQPWSVAIEAPLPGQRRVERLFLITDQSLATSGDYRNFFESDGQIYSHTIDTRTGKPVTHTLASVTVIADEAALADALATALLVLGPDDGMRFATDEDLAVFFLIRTLDGIEERMSPAFALIEEAT
jgi:thiamine biosynthesis lipoprotein